MAGTDFRKREKMENSFNFFKNEKIWYQDNVYYPSEPAIFLKYVWYEGKEIPYARIKRRIFFNLIWQELVVPAIDIRHRAED